MSARDLFHDIVKKALQKEGWIITHDPYPLPTGSFDLAIDLGAEKVIAAYRGEQNMDTITKYRQKIKTVLETHASHVWDDRIQAQIIIDAERDHYQLVYVGWRDSKRCYGVVIHIDIIDGKIWIQQDGTEIGTADELVEMGVPKQDIVLGFDPPNLRQYTDFAIN